VTENINSPALTALDERASRAAPIAESVAAQSIAIGGEVGERRRVLANL